MGGLRTRKQRCAMHLVPAAVMTRRRQAVLSRRSVTTPCRGDGLGNHDKTSACELLWPSWEGNQERKGFKLT